jgi:hypothetical protein
MHITDPGTRQAFTDGLRNLADYLDAHPELPVPPYGLDVSIHADALETGGREQVNQVADAIGTGIDPYSTDAHYRTGRRTFGPVSYSAISISDAEMARYYARTSYASCVVPDTQVSADA